MTLDNQDGYDKDKDDDNAQVWGSSAAKKVWGSDVGRRVPGVPGRGIVPYQNINICTIPTCNRAILPCHHTHHTTMPAYQKCLHTRSGYHHAPCLNACSSTICNYACTLHKQIKENVTFDLIHIPAFCTYMPWCLPDCFFSPSNASLSCYPTTCVFFLCSQLNRKTQYDQLSIWVRWWQLKVTASNSLIKIWGNYWCFHLYLYFHFHFSIYLYLY